MDAAFQNRPEPTTAPFPITAQRAEEGRQAPPHNLPAALTRFVGREAELAALERLLGNERLVSLVGRGDDDLRWLWLTNPVAFEVWDDEAWDRLTARAVAVARDSGAIAALRVAVAYRAGVIVHMGDFAGGSALLEESDAISAAAGLEPVGKYVWQVLAAWNGDEARTLHLIQTDVKDATINGEGRLICMAGFVTALLYNGLGRYDAALAGARHACEHDDLGLFGWALAELVEAGVRSGARDAAIEALARLEPQTMAAGTDWALGILARSRALLSDGPSAEEAYVEAIERLEHSRVTIHLARANLVYGEWLRRENRRQEARQRLRIAHERLHGMGAAAFAERARRELLATGETVRKRSGLAVDGLTPQEHQVARLAADGHTNSEIGSQLFISPRTAEYHLHKVYSKLGVTSRRSLRAALANAPVAAGTASSAMSGGSASPISG